MKAETTMRILELEWLSREPTGRFGGDGGEASALQDEYERVRTAIGVTSGMYDADDEHGSQVLFDLFEEARSVLERLRSLYRPVF